MAKKVTWSRLGLDIKKSKASPLFLNYRIKLLKNRVKLVIRIADILLTSSKSSYNNQQDNKVQLGLNQSFHLKRIKQLKMMKIIKHCYIIGK